MSEQPLIPSGRRMKNQTAAQILEEAVATMAREDYSNSYAAGQLPWCSLATDRRDEFLRAARRNLYRVLSLLHAHWLEQLKEELLSKENVERFGTGYWRAVAEKRKLQLQQRHDEAKDIALFRIALEAWLDSIPIEEGGDG